MMIAQPRLFEDGAAGATLSPDRRYRYRLFRTWEPDRPRANFIMLNPSTADEREDDPTIRRCIGFARRWGCGGLVVTNLFAFRATDPRDLGSADDPVGPQNDGHIADVAQDAEFVVCAWGAHKGAARRAETVRRMLDIEGIKTFVLRLTKGGDPAHPLYLPGDLYPIRWK